MNNLTAGRQAGPFPPFRARFPWRGGDLQTLRNTLVFRAPDFAPFPATRLELPMADGTGDVLLALLNRPAADAAKSIVSAQTTKPLIVLIHGLTGDEDSPNIRASATYHLRRGHPVVRLNMRGAGPSLTRCRERYHAGRSGDIAAALAALPATLTQGGVCIAGVSLGGNALLKFMAEAGHSAGASAPRILAAASVCAPVDLKAAQSRIMARRNAIYHRHLLTAMCGDLAVARGTPHDLYAANRARIRTIYDFDNLIVAPANGFDDAEDYYRRCSAGPMLPAIKVPTLVIHARTDPWVPAASALRLPWPAESGVTLLMAPDGGHVGFHAADSPVPWHDRVIGQFFDAATHNAGDSPSR